MFRTDIEGEMSYYSSVLTQKQKISLNVKAVIAFVNVKHLHYSVLRLCGVAAILVGEIFLVSLHRESHHSWVRI